MLAPSVIGSSVRVVDRQGEGHACTGGKNGWKGGHHMRVRKPAGHIGEAGKGCAPSVVPLEVGYGGIGSH